jgi:signal transduction histidine kinase
LEATTSASTTSYRTRWRMLGGDRFYTLARLLILVLLFTIGNFLTPANLLPPNALTHPFGFILYAYAGFSIVVTIALFVPPMEPILRLAFLFDIGFITLLTLFSLPEVENQALFFPLYLLPLVALAIRQRPSVSMLAGIVTALLYSAAYIGNHYIGVESPPMQVLDWVSLGLRALTIVFIPWLTSGLAERWSANNRLSVELAQQQSDAALREAQAYRDRSRALYEVAYTLSTTMNYQSVMDSALAESGKLVPSICGAVMLSTGNPDELYILAVRGMPSGVVGQSVKVAQGSLAQVLRSTEPRVVESLGQDGEVGALLASYGCQSACCVPLRAGLRTYGLLVVGSDRPRGFTQEQVEMVTALANYAIIALHNAQLVEDLRAERAKLLSKEEEVRHQLARDLHDGPAQALAAITMNLEFIKRLLDRDPARVPDELAKLSGLSKRTTHEVRTMLFELRPLVLETQGLRETLAQYLERFQSNATRIILETSSIDNVRLDPKTEGTLFNIIQESINNALKHARAGNIWVRLKRNGDLLEATVQDDGRGFDLDKVRLTYEKRGSFGLLNIEERAKLVGGQAELHSAPGQGTTVRVIVPAELF